MSLSTPARSANNRPLVGAAWIILSGMCFVGVNVTVKSIGTAVPASQSSFLRFAFGLVYVLPVLPLLWRNWPPMRDLKIFGHRGVMHVIAVLCWFYAMARLPLAEVTTLNYMQPVIIALLAPLLLGEAFRMRRLAAVLVAVAGAVIMLRPGFRELGVAHLSMLVTATFFALSYMLIKPVTERVNPNIVVAMLSLTVTIGLAPFAYWSWQPITPLQAGTLFITATFATAGHYAMTMAFRSAPITVTQPMTALQLLWSILIGALVFDEIVDIFVIIGAMMIAGAVIFIALREASAPRR